MRARIAVIDDDAVFVELMEELLGQGEGYDVVTCTRWVDSVEFIKDTRPDLLMLDLMLGRQQRGWAILEQLRLDPAFADLPVILCTAAAPLLVGTPARATVEYVAKPFDIDALVATIGRMLAPVAAPEPA
jgi:CheY-like chemotaxis protein